MWIDKYVIAKMALEKTALGKLKGYCFRGNHDGATTLGVTSLGAAGLGTTVLGETAFGTVEIEKQFETPQLRKN